MFVTILSGSCIYVWLVRHSEDKVKNDLRHLIGEFDDEALEELESHDDVRLGNRQQKKTARRPEASSTETVNDESAPEVSATQEDQARKRKLGRAVRQNNDDWYFDQYEKQDGRR